MWFKISESTKVVCFSLETNRLKLGLCYSNKLKQPKQLKKENQNQRQILTRQIFVYPQNQKNPWWDTYFISRRDTSKRAKKRVHIILRSPSIIENHFWYSLKKASRLYFPSPANSKKKKRKKNHATIIISPQKYSLNEASIFRHGLHSGVPGGKISS